jgi:putative transposase
MKYSTTGKGVYELKYDLVFVCRNRQKVLTEDIRDEIKLLISHILEKNDCALLEFSGAEDYIKLKMELSVAADIIKLINSFKTVTSRMTNKKYKISSLWNHSYLILTSGIIADEVLNKYIENQGNLVIPPKDTVK